MNARLATFLLWTFLLAGCDLEEAERLDLTRGSARGIQPKFEGLLIDGETDLVLTRVLTSVWDPEGFRRWSLAWSDLSDDSRLPSRWRIVGALDGLEVLVVEGQGGVSTSIRALAQELWMYRAKEIGLRLDLLWRQGESWHPWIPDLPQRIRDDRPGSLLECTFSFAPGEIRKPGDTLFVAVRNTGVNAIAVYGDHSGVRQIGAYELLVPPGGRDTLRWLVTSTPSDDRWIDLGWGDWGHHERRSFRVL